MCKSKRKTHPLFLSAPLVSLSPAPFPLFSCFLFSFGKAQVTAGKKPQRIKKSNSKMSHLKYHLMNRLVCELTMGRAHVLQRIGGSAGAALPHLMYVGWTSAHLPETFPTSHLPALPSFTVWHVASLSAQQHCGRGLHVHLHLPSLRSSRSPSPSGCGRPLARPARVSCPASLSADLLLALSHFYYRSPCFSFCKCNATHTC